MSKVIRLTESDLVKLVKRIVENEDSNQEGNDWSIKLKEIDDYITKNGERPPVNDYRLILDIISAAYEKRFEPGYLSVYLLRKLKNVS